ncbi:hypothetical protein ACOACO_17605 [Nocardioides sp. CPCC 205120]|uniref:hypothetical protein n=1 Tax=Nocardioides sp. CPCC 205120 TaxID=3406462 RepID=UPI003B5113AD
MITHAVPRALESDWPAERAIVTKVLVTELRWPAPQAAGLAGEVLLALGIDECRVCRCTDASACQGGCACHAPTDSIGEHA